MFVLWFFGCFVFAVGVPRVKHGLRGPRVLVGNRFDTHIMSNRSWSLKSLVSGREVSDGIILYLPGGTQ